MVNTIKYNITILEDELKKTIEIIALQIEIYSKKIVFCEDKTIKTKDRIVILKKYISKCKEIEDEYSNFIDDVKEDLSKVNKECTSIKNKIDKLKPTSEKIVKKSDGTFETITIDSDEKQRTSLNSKFADVNEEINTIQSKLSRLESSYNLIKNKRLETEKRRNGLITIGEKIEKLIKNLKININKDEDFKNSLETVQAESEKLKTEITSIAFPNIIDRLNESNIRTEQCFGICNDINTIERTLELIRYNANNILADVKLFNDYAVAIKDWDDTLRDSVDNMIKNFEKILKEKVEELEIAYKNLKTIKELYFRYNKMISILRW